MAVLVVVVLSILAWGAQGTTAEAHVGRAARLYVSNLEVQPGVAANTWTVQAHVVDEDSGRPVLGLDVSVTGGASGPVALADPSKTGHYTGTLTAEAGAVTLHLDAREGPGSEPALPFQRAWNLVLQGGGAAHASDGGMEHTAHHRDQGRGALLLAGVLAGAALIALLALVTTRRHQLAQ